MSPALRPPLVGYNHNVRYAGRLYHVQTEDSGPRKPHLITHLFYEGTILATKRQDYEAALPEPDVRTLMKAQHKGLMKELKLAIFDEKITRFFADRDEPLMPEEPEMSLPAVGPGAQIASALDLDAIGPKSGPRAEAAPAEPAPADPQPEPGQSGDGTGSTSFVRKGGPKERLAVPILRVAPPRRPAPPVIRLEAAPAEGRSARRKSTPVPLRWLSSLAARFRPAPPAAARTDGAASPLADVDEREIDDALGAFLGD